MHNIEPFFNWRHLYTAEEDPKSPFYGRTYSEFEFTQVIYNYYIHPQWDDFGSRTLYLKILFIDYDEQYVIIELMGEWNDAIENDIMELKREIVDHLSKKGRFPLIESLFLVALERRVSIISPKYFGVKLGPYFFIQN